MNETTYEQATTVFDEVQERFLSGIGKLLPPATPAQPQSIVECLPQTQREHELDRLSKLSPADYGAARTAASDRLGIPVTFLDKEWESRRKAEKKAEPGQGREIEFEDIPPAPEPVNGSDLGDRLAAIFTKFAVLPSHGAETLALWVLFTYCYDQFEIAPRIDLRSPEKQCGKTTVLGLLRRLAWRALLSSNITPSTIFRVVSAHTPTLLIDEMDTFTDANEELRGILNSGHTRDGATVIRNVGEQHEPRTFSTWAPMAFAHIGRIPDTLEDRSVCIPMKRKIARERIASLRQVGPAAAALRLDLRTLVGQIVRWIADEGPRLAGTEPPVLEGLSDRANDNWAPLLSLAEVLGGPWPERARTAAGALSGPTAIDHESVKVELLADIRDEYTRQGVDRLSSTGLCDLLVLLEERPWGIWKHGKPLTPVQLARLLRHFNISSRNLRLETGVVKGYYLEDFDDAFERYIPSPFPDPTTSNRYTATIRAQSGDHPLFQPATEGVCSVSENGLNPAPRAACSVVADQHPQSELEEVDADAD